MKTVLLVARVGSTRDGIQALLASISDVELVAVTENVGAAIVHASETCPNLIVLIIDHLTDELKEGMVALRNRCLETHTLVLTDSEVAQQDTLNSQIDSTLPIGIPATELSQAIETLLKTDESPLNSNLIVTAFTDEEGASKTQQAIKMMRGSKFWGLVNTVIVSKYSSGKVIVQQQREISAHQLTPGRQLPDVLVEEILGDNPEKGTQRLVEAGLSERFLEKITSALVPNSSAILIYIRPENQADTRQVLDALKQFTGTVHHTTVSAGIEAAILNQTRKSVNAQ